jgi:hypothetical protein
MKIKESKESKKLNQMKDKDSRKDAHREKKDGTKRRK